MHVRIVRPPKDSTAFTVSDVVHACQGGGVLFDAVNGPNGVLAWVRSPAPLAVGSYPLLGRADSTTPRGAVVAVRFIWHDVAHGFPVDSGVLTLSAVGPSYRGRVQGSGTDLGLAIKGTVDITIDSIAPQPDTLACGAKG
jgi:hypothetical protein